MYGEAEVVFGLTMLTGTSVLYGPPHRLEDDFVLNVQQIIRNLFEISTEIPSEQFFSNNGNNSDLALRTTASLHLMIYQVKQSNETRPISGESAKLMAGISHTGHSLDN